MISLDIAFTFFGFALALALVPGPDNIFVMTQSALFGRLSGIFVTLGLATGLIFHTAAVAFGVAAIFETSQFAFNVLKYMSEEILNKLFNNQNLNYVFIYTPPKVGSTTLVSSLRISLGNTFNVIHIHDDIMLSVLTGVNNVTVNEIINYIAQKGNNVYMDNKQVTGGTTVNNSRTTVSNQRVESTDRATKELNNVYGYALA